MSKISKTVTKIIKFWYLIFMPYGNPPPKHSVWHILISILISTWRSLGVSSQGWITDHDWLQYLSNFYYQYWLHFQYHDWLGNLLQFYGSFLPDYDKYSYQLGAWEKEPPNHNVIPQILCCVIKCLTRDCKP